LTYPTGQVVTYTYDAASRLVTVTDWAGRVTTYTYDAAGRQTGVAYPNGVEATYAYDNADRLLSIAHSSPVSGTIAVFTYTLDSVGNRLTMVDLEGTTSYNYDDLYRLTEVTYPDAETVTYAYDPMGNNRTAMTSTVSGVVTYTYDVGDRLQAAGPITFTWDANGNMTGKGSAAYAFDALDRLTGVVSGTTTVRFAYNGDGVRVRKAVNGVGTDYVQDIAAPLPVVVAETSGGQTNRYVYGNDLLAQVDPGGSPSFFHADGLGSTRALSNAAGQRTDAYSYDVFGALRSHTGGAAQPFAFAGEQMDGELGLAFLRARYYDPEFGRFISQDRFPGTAFQTQSLNGYAYAGNNPILETDPAGLFNLKQFGVGAFDLLTGAGTIATSLTLGAIATGLCATGVGCVAGAPIGAYAANQALVAGQKIGYGAVELGMGIRKSSSDRAESYEAYDPLREGAGWAGSRVASALSYSEERGRKIGRASKDVLDLVGSLVVTAIPGSKADTIAYTLWQQGAFSNTARARLFTSLLANPLTKATGNISHILKLLNLTASPVYAPGHTYYAGGGGGGGAGGGDLGGPPSSGK